MEVPSVSHTHRVSGNFEKSDFTIAQTRHTFDILSSGLYSKKAQAIIRELSCNALDGHVVAGTQDTKFILYLPNRVEPFFKIRDFGTGLSHEFVMKNYTEYMFSTKKDSNDQIGCFGLGSKSPFAYTRTWNVCSFQEGEKRTYSMIVAGNGLPQCLHIATEVTDETNGLEVSFAVNKDDIHDFLESAQRVFRVFEEKARPEVKGVRNFEVSSRAEPILSGTYWSVFGDRGVWSSGRRYHREPTQTAIMGNVEYPLEVQSSFSPNAKAILSLPIIINFPIGSFAVTPSRESISWTDFSLKRINEILEDIHDEISASFSDQLEVAPSLWEARKIAFQVLKEKSLSKLNLAPTWKGKKFSTRILCPTGTVRKLTSATRVKDHSVSMSCKTESVGRIEPIDTEFFLADFKSAHYRTASYVRSFDTADKCVYLLEPATKTGYRDLLKSIGISAKDVRPASTIPKKKKRRSTSNGSTSVHAGKKTSVFKYTQKAAINKRSSDSQWSAHEVDMDAGGVYVEVSRYKAVTGSVGDIKVMIPPDGIWDTRNFLKKLGVKDLEIIGVKTAKIRYFDKHPKWTNLKDFVAAKVLRLWGEDDALQQAFYLFQDDENIQNVREQNAVLAVVDNLMGEWEEMPDKGVSPYPSVMSDILSEIKEKRTKKSLSEALAHLHYTWMDRDISLCSVHRTKSLPDYKGRMLVAYPMFQVLLNNRYGLLRGEMPHFIEYIKFMDGLRAEGVKL